MTQSSSQDTGDPSVREDKKAYAKPELRDLGTVQELTRTSGQPFPAPDSGNYPNYYATSY